MTLFDQRNRLDCTWPHISRVQLTCLRRAVRPQWQNFRPPRCKRRRRLLQWAQLQAATVDVPSKLCRSHHRWDLVALGNVCLDIVHAVDELPPLSEIKSRDLLLRLSASSPSRESWEVGGNCNASIAAARLGMRVACIGNVGVDVYGDFISDTLRGEGVALVQPITPAAFSAEIGQTLLCFVLTARCRVEHAFCSVYDFGPWPLLGSVQELEASVLQTLRSARALLLNACTFDELPIGVVLAAVRAARAAGGAVLFDPGPRCYSMAAGPRRAALDSALSASDVVLMTQEEAEAITGYADPEAAARHILERQGAATQWCIVKLGAQGAVLRCKAAADSFWQPALQVEVRDTVGCGDSFAAAIALGYTQQQPVAATMALANAVGASTAMGVGAGRNVADAHTVLKLLTAQADGTARLSSPCALRNESSSNGSPQPSPCLYAAAADALRMLRTSLRESALPGIRLH